MLTLNQSRPVLVLSLLLLAVGCAGTPCEKLPPYAGSRPAPPLRVPEGLSKPKSDRTLEVPEVASAAEIAPCSDLPPSQQRRQAPKAPATD